MIHLDHLTKYFPTGQGRKTIVDNLTATFPTGVSVALLGRNGAGKSTLLKLISGTIRPNSGRVMSTGSISYLTGVQNTRFVARLYGVDSDSLVHFVEDFAELGPHFRMPLRTYSAGMKSRLSFGVSMGIPFDTYLVDEVTSVGDGAFRHKSVQVFDKRMETAGAIVVTHSPPMVKRLCTMAAVLERGQLYFYDDLDAALDHHDHNLAQTA
jgi:capsular polysaccharide transport system ATP-binding protein